MVTIAFIFLGITAGLLALPVFGDIVAARRVAHAVKAIDKHDS